MRPMAVLRPSTVRSAALRSRALSLAKAFSIGLKSGYRADGSEGWRLPRILSRTFCPLWQPTSRWRALEREQGKARCDRWAEIAGRSGLRPAKTRSSPSWRRSPTSRSRSSYRSQNANAKVHRKRCRHVSRPPTSAQAQGLSHRQVGERFGVSAATSASSVQAGWTSCWVLTSSESPRLARDAPVGGPWRRRRVRCGSVRRPQYRDRSSEQKCPCLKLPKLERAAASGQTPTGIPSMAGLSALV